MQLALDELLANPLIWRFGDRQRAVAAGIATGFTELDAVLPDGGWPAAGLTELLCDAVGVGEMSLLLPIMAACASAHSTQGSSLLVRSGIIWIAPPCLPYAPALAAASVDLRKLLIVRPTTSADTWWAAEQAMRSGAAALVMAWLPRDTDYAMLRRLQLVCSSAPCAGFVYRTSNAARQPSPAPLRIALSTTGVALSTTGVALGATGVAHGATVIEVTPSQGTLKLQILKCRGMNAAPSLYIDARAHRWNQRFAAAHSPGWATPGHPYVTADA